MKETGGEKGNRRKLTLTYKSVYMKFVNENVFSFKS